MGKHCLCMSHVPWRDEKEKLNICNVCKRNSKKLQTQFPFNYIKLEDFVTCDEIKRINMQIKNINITNFWKFTKDRIPVGQLSAYEFFLNHKLSTKNIPENLWPEMQAKLFNSLIALTAVKKIMASLNIDRIACYNVLYSINQVVAEFAAKKNLSCFAIHAGSNHSRMYRTLTVFKTKESQALVNRSDTCKRYRDLVIRAEDFYKIADHAKQFITSKSFWVYSSPPSKGLSKNLMAKYEILQNTKVILAVMRSNDERFGAELAGLKIFKKKGLFNSQIEWLEWLSSFAKKNQHINIIFRLHPREFPNKRESVMAQSAKLFKDYYLSQKWPENLHINFPNDNLSLYEFLKISDLVLNNTSTVGLEASLFGIPVLGVDEDVYAFDPILQREPKSIADYEREILSLIQQKWSFHKVKQAYRWLNFINNEVSIDIEDCFDERNIKVKKPKWRDPIRWIPRFLRPDTGFEEINHCMPQGPKEIEKLTFAILHNEDSHIGRFPMKNGDANLEDELIKKDVLHRASLCADPEDKPFWNRIYCMLGTQNKKDFVFSSS